MPKAPTRAELEKRIKELERENQGYRCAQAELQARVEGYRTLLGNLNVGNKKKPWHTHDCSLESQRPVDDHENRLWIDGVIQEVTERKRIQKALERRDIIFKTVSHAAARFLGGPFKNENIQNILEIFGRAIQASRVYIFQNQIGKDGKMLTDQRFEWVAPGIHPQSDNATLRGLALADAGFARWENTLGQGKAIYGHIREFPRCEQPLLAAQHILSIAVAPIFVGSRWWGFVGFDACEAERNWSADEIEALTIAANVLGAAILHVRSDKALQESEERFKTLTEQAPFGLSIMQPDRRFEYFNPKFTTIFGYTLDDLPDKDTWFEKAYPDPKFRDHVRTVWKKDSIHEANPREVAIRIFKVRCKDGQDKIIRFRNVALAGGRQLLSYEDITSQAKAEKMLKRSEKRLHFLTSRLLTAQENERRRMSLELHDDLGQRLAVLKLQIHGVANGLRRDQIKQVVDCHQILNHVSEIIESIRRTAHDLIPSGIHDLGLAVALKHLFKDFADHSDMHILVADMPDIQAAFPPDTAVIIYRIFQEVMTNIARHAKAKTISVAIQKQAKNIVFLVEDDGVGFCTETIAAAGPADKGLGLAAIDERIRMIEGRLEIVSRINSGTRVTFTVPTS